MLKTTIDRAECEIDFDWYLRGSVLRGTVESGATGCRSRLVIDSPADKEDILRVVRLAKQGCFAEQLVKAAVPLVSTCIVNGTEVEVHDG